MPGDPGALPQGGGQGPLGNTVDGIPCEASMSNNYHVHAFVGMYVNGVEFALPDAIGIVNARGDFFDSASGWSNQELYGDCFYDIHTHDPSGMVHMESADPTGAPPTASLFTLGNLFDIWGIQVSLNQFGPYMGPITIYTSLNSAQEPCDETKASNCEVGRDQYQLWTGDPAQLPLYGHEAIWIEVGTGNPDKAHLPGVFFATRY